MLAAILLSTAQATADGSWQPIHFAADGESGNLAAGKWRIEVVAPDGRRSAARVRSDGAGELPSFADGTVSVAAGLHRAFVPVAAREGRLRLEPLDAAARTQPPVWTWRPPSGDDDALWFELPRRVLHGLSGDARGISGRRPVHLRWQESTDEFGRLVSDRAGSWGMNLPAGDGAARQRPRPVSIRYGDARRATELVAVTYAGDDTQAIGTPDVFNQPGNQAVPTPGLAPCVGVYPNPWRPNAVGSASEYVVFFGLKKGDGVDIYTISGERVRSLGGPYETQVAAVYTPDPSFPSGAPAALKNWNYILWDGRNERGNEVADGVYLFVINLDFHECWDGETTIAGRLTVIR